MCMYIRITVRTYVRKYTIVLNGVPDHTGSVLTNARIPANTKICVHMYIQC